ncbi:ATP-dependent DNA helicase [Cupriavidus gilardii]|uniref:ATP-dependent DNA helicase n=1 Tax=Cupriavidus gilardii TaxID=82541 RepID=A0ABY4VLG6_9BURK|nr:ATP-dependent DNA helicase [Cupriavidus gilardii]USE77868.1 ATP-dependent DNA helicase [Cupriavidus gilardii]
MSATASPSDSAATVQDQPSASPREQGEPAPAADSEPRYIVAVRTLCDFTARAGDLDLRFTPSPTALEGMAGHATVTSRRPAGYRTEISLSADFGPLRVRGRADGYDPDRRRLEEVKTVRGDAAEVPAHHRHLHWAQAKVYGWLMCQREALDDIEIAVVYFDIVSGRELAETQRFAAQTLRECFEAQCRAFIGWAEQELAHRAGRDLSLDSLAFPHAGFRAGQRELAESVYRTNLSGRCLLAQAPTGIGKTVGTIFPALKAMPKQKIDKLFVLSARSTGRALALEATRGLAAQRDAMPLRVLEMVARDKACEYPGRACHGEACPLARGFHDRLPAARAQAAGRTMLDRAQVREIALAHDICPYYLSQEMARWSDVVVADYNYYFDRTALLHAFALHDGWRVSVLVDEAHQLPERARDMYSAALDQAEFRTLRRQAPADLRRVFDRVGRQWNAVVKNLAGDYRAEAKVPAPLLDAFEGLCAALLERFTERPTEQDPALQRFYFDVLQFCRLAEQIGPHSVFDMTRMPARGAHANVRLGVRNLVPAHFLRPRLAAAHSVSLFSATLAPASYYADMLGLPERWVWHEVPSPFQPDQLRVRVASHISTRFAHRQRSLPDIVELIAAQYREKPGNYLAFFSSHDYLGDALALFTQRHADIPSWSQARGMDEREQADFLEAFQPGGQGVGFAVLGGPFAEGVDLPGDRLIGAFVATLGLPQFNPVNEQLRSRLEDTFGDGYAYAYLYPGLRKVVQAAGRVIRTSEDRGVVYLIDDRFAQPSVRELLPAWWRVETWPSRFVSANIYGP